MEESSQWHGCVCASTRSHLLRPSLRPRQPGRRAEPSERSLESDGSRTGPAVGVDELHPLDGFRKRRGRNSVLEGNHEHDHEKLECRRSAPQSTKRCAWESGQSALPPIVPPSADNADQSQPNAAG